MDQEREDYREPDWRPVWLPPVGLLIVVAFLSITGVFPLIGLFAVGALRVH
jgi:hypothetical protein